MELLQCAPAEADRRIAREIAEQLRERARAARTFVLGLATGRSPLGVYRELVALHRADALPIQALRTFNLDEYLGLAPDDPRSFQALMRRVLYEPLGLAREQWAIPRGDLPSARWAEQCTEYGRAIRDAGGIDLQLLGLGRNGHIGFNEPGAAPEARVRVVQLAESTRCDAAAAFGGIECVPRAAISIGVADILAARSIRLLVYGVAKHAVLAASVERPPGPDRPASWLQDHPDCRVYTDWAPSHGQSVLSEDPRRR
jgi:glucosamine-6-phosphate deaminase